MNTLCFHIVTISRLHLSFWVFVLALVLGQSTALYSQNIANPAAGAVNQINTDSSGTVSSYSGFGHLKISRFNTDTFHGSAALGDVTNFDIWNSPARTRLIGYGLSLVRPKVEYTLGFTQSKLSFNEIPKRFGIPPNLPDFSRTESITFVNMNLGVDYLLPQKEFDKLSLGVGPTLYGARYMYSNEARNYLTVGLGAKASYRFGLFYFGMEYRAMVLNPEYFNNFFRWEIGLWFDL